MAQCAVCCGSSGRLTECVRAYYTHTHAQDIFIAYDQQNIYTYSYRRDRLHGPDVMLVGTTRLPYAHMPLVLYNGDLHCQTQSGRLSTIRLATHTFDVAFKDKTDTELDELFNMYILLRRLVFCGNTQTIMDTGLFGGLCTSSYGSSSSSYV
jgi:hypothetical protein